MEWWRSLRDESNKDTERPKSSESKMDESEKGRGLSEKEKVGKRESERDTMAMMTGGQWKKLIGSFGWPWRFNFYKERERERERESFRRTH